MQINRIFDTGSDQLTKYLNDNKVGKKIAGPPGKAYTILEVETRVDIPPDPNTGHAVTLVLLTIG